MPLPPCVPFQYIDSSSSIRTGAITTAPTTYRPTPEYYPTGKVVRCRECDSVGVAEFPGGFNLKDGDALMQGRVIRGICKKCDKEVELIPLRITPDAERDYYHLYYAQKSIDEMVRRGIPLTGTIIPAGKIDEFERRARDVDSE